MLCECKHSAHQNQTTLLTQQALHDGREDIHSLLVDHTSNRWMDGWLAAILRQVTGVTLQLLSSHSSVSFCLLLIIIIIIIIIVVVVLL